MQQLDLVSDSNTDDGCSLHRPEVFFFYGIPVAHSLQRMSGSRGVQDPRKQVWAGKGRRRRSYPPKHAQSGRDTFLIDILETANDFNSQLYQTGVSNVQPGCDSYPTLYREISWPFVSC